jgi:hypothetical protein
MAYSHNKGNWLNFFTPNLAISGSATKPLAAINVAAANATHGEFVCVVPCTIRQAQATVILNTVSTSTVPVITLTKYTLPGAGGTATTIDTISIPDASSLGQTLYVKDLSTSFLPGQVLQVKHTLGTGGSVAGEVVVSCICEDDPESLANSSLMIESA